MSRDADSPCDSADERIGERAADRGRRPCLAEYARRVHRDAAEGRRRSLARRLGGALVRKYVRVVPSVFGASGELAAFRLLIPTGDALARLRSRAVLTLDSATEILGGFRFGAAPASFVYLPCSADVVGIGRDGIGRDGIGERLPGSWLPMWLAPPGEELLHTVVPIRMPPSIERDGFRVVDPAFLIRELLGFHGLRLDLVARIEARIAGPCGLQRPGPGDLGHRDIGGSFAGEG